MALGVTLDHGIQNKLGMASAPARTPKVRRSSLTEIALDKQKQHKVSVFETPLSKSAIAARKEARCAQLANANAPLTGQRDVNRVTGHVKIVAPCTASAQASLEASARKEFQDYRPVVALLDKSLEQQHWSNGPGGGEQPALFGDR